MANSQHNENKNNVNSVIAYEGGFIVIPHIKHVYYSANKNHIIVDFIDGNHISFMSDGENDIYKLL